MATDRHRPGRVQDLLSVADIDGDVVWLTGGGGRAVLAVSSRNFALTAAAEQEALLAGYRAFLGSLRFPLQVLVRVEPAPVERYLAGLGPRPGLTPALARLALDHEAFVRRLARERTLLDRRFFVVIPAGDAAPAPALALPRPWPARRRTPTPSQQAALTVQELLARCAHVTQGLTGLGLRVRRLDGAELAALWSAMLSPDRARRPPVWTAGPVATVRPLTTAEVTDAR